MAMKTGNTADNWLRGTTENDRLYGGDDRDV